MYTYHTIIYNILRINFSTICIIKNAKIKF